jgi:hypothetical protein
MLCRVPLGIRINNHLRVAVEPAGAAAFATNDPSQPLAAPRLRWRALRVLYGWRAVVVPEHDWARLDSAAARQLYLATKLGQAGVPGFEAEAGEAAA